MVVFGKMAFKQSLHVVILGGPEGSFVVEIPFAVLDYKAKTEVALDFALHLPNMKLS